LVILIGIILGILLGLTGAGGAIFAVPLLVILLSLPLSEAMGVALAAVAASAMLGTYLHRHNVMWRPAFILSFGGIFTAPIGKWFAIHINEMALTLSFSALSLYIAYVMWKKSTLPEQASAINAGSAVIRGRIDKAPLSNENNAELKMLKKRFFMLSIGGGSIGLASGLFGVGGGFLIIPFLMALSPISMKQAVATSLSAISVISLVGFISHEVFTQGAVIAQPTAILIPLILSALLAMLMSKKISNKLSDSSLKKGFSVLLVIVTVFMVIKQLFSEIMIP
jgi:uncharacterized protein